MTPLTFSSRFRKARAVLLWLLCIVTAGLHAADSAPQLIASREPGWPQFRGRWRNGVSDERGLLREWPENGPKQSWAVDAVGTGFSSPIFGDGRIFITGDVGDQTRIFALDLAGKKLWEMANGASWTENYPGARASVTFHRGRVYHQNAHGRVVCLDAATGAERWSVDLIRQFAGKNITWALSECLLVDDRAVYATAGGADALMVALHPESGKVVWKTPPLADADDGAIESPSYVSPILVRFAGRELIIGCSLRNLFCVDAANGALQWTHRFPTSYSVLAAMPTLVKDAVFMTAPHGRGGRLLRLVAPSEPGGKVGKEEVWSSNLDTCQGSLLHANGRLVGSFYGPRKGWAALDPATGQTLFTAPEFIKGAGIFADERLYALSEDGWMRLVEIGTDKFIERGKFRLAPAKSDAWAHPVIHDGRLYLRYHGTLRCFDIRAGTTAQN